MGISREEVFRVARLAHIDLTDEEAAALPEQLDRIVAYVDSLSAVAAEGSVERSALPPTSLRADEPRRSLSVADVLRGAPAPRSLRFAAVGGAKVSAELITHARALGLPAYEGYGLSECASVVALNVPGADRVGSVGKVLPHLQVEIEDFDKFSYMVKTISLTCVQAPPNTSLKELLLRQSAEIERRISYLLESFCLVEVDEFNCLAQVRSTMPYRKNEDRLYYEVLLRQGQSLTFARYCKERQSEKREVVPSYLTQETFERLVDDLAATLRLNLD